MSRNVLKHNGYTGVAEVDSEDGLIHGRVLELRDVVTFEGTTPAEAREGFEAAVDDYLAQCEEEGREPNKPFSGQFNLRIPPELHRAAVEAAEAGGLSLNAFVEMALRQAVSSPHGVPKPKPRTMSDPQVR